MIYEEIEGFVFKEPPVGVCFVNFLSLDMAVPTDTRLAFVKLNPIMMSYLKKRKDVRVGDAIVYNGETRRMTTANLFISKEVKGIVSSQDMLKSLRSLRRQAINHNINKLIFTEGHKNVNWIVTKVLIKRVFRTTKIHIKIYSKG